MKIGKQEHRSSALSTSSADTIVVRGKDLCQDLIGKVSFTEYVWFLLTGEPADDRSSAACSIRRWSRSPNTDSCPACRRAA